MFNLFYLCQFLYFLFVCAELLIETFFFFRLSRKMAETQTLNFGPEWLRALSGGVGSSIVASPPLSPALPKYKLADYRYGREEMLALYVKDNMIPVDLHDKEFLPILQEEPLPPLALVPFTEEEQRNFSMSINSAAVLRLTGRGGGTVAGAPRGRSSSRGRGRGRGDGGFYQRSFDDVEGGFGHGGREMHRSQSWEERGDRRFEKPGRKDPVRANYEDAGAGNSRKHEFIRSESDNWRMTRDEQNGEDDDGGWRIAGSRRDNERWCPPSPDGPRSAGWREHPDQRRRFPFDSRGEDGGYRRPRSGSGSVEEERDSLPEWCLEDAEEETGTFDSSGAFLSLKKAPKEPILEEAELDFRPLEENEECTEKDDSESEQTKDTDTESSRRESDRNEGEKAVSLGTQLRNVKPLEMPVAVAPVLPHSMGIVGSISRPSVLPSDMDEDEGLKHFEQEAEKMVAYLQDGGLDDERLATKIGHKPTALPIGHEAAFKWFYKDPQGEIQGPFNNQEMSEWFQAGYFTMTLQVKRGCDEMFQPLGEMMKLWGRVPFTAGPALPPILVIRHSCISVTSSPVFQHPKGFDLFEEALQRQREQEEAQRRKKEEQERLAREEALRQLEERRKEEEERRQREEFLRKHQEEERRKQEELEAQRRLEEEKRLEEEAAAAALERQQQEEQKKREQEAQRQQELQRQRQQQQEALRRLQQQQQQQQLAQMKALNSSVINYISLYCSKQSSKKVEEEEKLLKLFQGANKNQDGFMQWCEQTLHTLNTANNLDVPTFASFLKEVDSPYEVHDYVRAYLGDTPQAKDFAKQFLERRAKQNANQQKPQQGQQQKQQDSVWGLSQVSQSVLQQQRFETVTSGKKKKKQKMVRADPSLLGFSVNASSERLNMGEIETVED
uniref:GRB10 interacting GYF protein 2 n=1 Tax=Cyprinus carpio carpio TaxID=630221 RepID=A0A8C1DDG8_CYPCA